MGGREGVLVAQCCASAVGFAAFGDMFVLLIWVERWGVVSTFFQQFLCRICGTAFPHNTTQEAVQCFCAWAGGRKHGVPNP